MANTVFDFKKEYKDLYMPKVEPVIIDVPEFSFIKVDGKGNANTEGGEFYQAVELLYTLSYTIKMSSKSGNQPQGFFEYVVPPLEGLWWFNDSTDKDFSQKDKYLWTSMIRQPEFVTQEVFDWACKEAARKKPRLDTSKARFQSFTEGLCVQMMHIGPYADEPKTIALMVEFIKENNYQNAIGDVRSDGSTKRHHEIYLSDPRKTEPSKMKTVLRHPIKK